MEERFRALFRGVHAAHPDCGSDEWLGRACSADGSVRSVVWSRRNGPWRQVDLLWVGAAPGNAGGRGSGEMGAHGTRIPFGGDIAGGNLDVLLSAIGLDRNATFITAALNQLPERGGGEPRVSELRAPVGEIPSSLHLLRGTLLAAAPRLVVALGNVALRSTVAAGQLEAGPRVLPGLARLQEAGLRRGAAAQWPEAFAPDDAFLREWAELSGGRPLPHILWLLHPSAQNMSPYAGRDTVFHARMLETLTALRRAIPEVLGRSVPERRPSVPLSGPGVYALPEWRDAVGPRHAELDRLWREKGV